MVLRISSFLNEMECFIRLRPVSIGANVELYFTMYKKGFASEIPEEVFAYLFLGYLYFNQYLYNSDIALSQSIKDSNGVSKIQLSRIIDMLQIDLDVLKVFATNLFENNLVLQTMTNSTSFDVYLDCVVNDLTCSFINKRHKIS